MLRKVILMTAVFLLVMAGVASARPGVANLAAVQDETAEEGSFTASPVSSFILGERYSNGLFDLEIQDSFSVDSPLYPGYDEVRLSAAFRHHTDVPWLPSSYAFTGEHGYPVLQLVDGAGETHALPTNVLPLWIEVVDEEADTITDVQLGDFSYQTVGFALSHQPRGIPARWSVGFRVPSASNHDLILQASFGGLVLAEWDLESNPVPSAPWERPAGFDLVALGDSIPWGESLSVEPKAVATEVCADPQFGHVAVDASLLVNVSSLSDRDAVWPGVEYPDMVAIAIWEDGTTARYAEESPAFYDDTDAEKFDRLILPFGEHVLIPPRTDHERFLEFVAPRDGRFADVTDNPVALVLYPPDGPPVWVDLDTSPSGTIAEFECDVPTFHLFAVDRAGAAPEPPAPVLEPETVFDVQPDV